MSDLRWFWAGPKNYRGQVRKPHKPATSRRLLEDSKADSWRRGVVLNPRRRVGSRQHWSTGPRGPRTERGPVGRSEWGRRFGECSCDKRSTVKLELIRRRVIVITNNVSTDALTKEQLQKTCTVCGVFLNHQQKQKLWKEASGVESGQVTIDNVTWSWIWKNAFVPSKQVSHLSCSQQEIRLIAPWKVVTSANVLPQIKTEKYRRG